MLEDTTPENQAMGPSNAHWTTRPDIGAVPTGDKTTMEEWSTEEGKEDMVAEDPKMRSWTTATTVSSESKQTGSSSNVQSSSCFAEGKTDPTSSPSEMLEESDRKYMESPIDSDRAVYGSSSVHSESSESSTEGNGSKRNPTAAVDLDKVEAIGGQFDDLCIGREAASFHIPVNEMEARFIIGKVQKANTTMEDINLRPEAYFRDPGSSFQVSARPKEPSKLALDAEGDIAYSRKVHFAPDSLPDLDLEEGYNIEGSRRRYPSCCIIL